MLKLLNRMVGSLHRFLESTKGGLPKDDYKSFNLGNNTQHYVLPSLKSSTNLRKEITKELKKY